MYDWNCQFVCWLSKLGSRYFNEYLSKYDINRLKNDNQYALKYFLYHWAYERRNTPYGYKAAAIKTVSLLDIKSNVTKKNYEEFYLGKRNDKNNPGMDNRLYEIQICDIIKNIEDCKLEAAFDSIKLNGVGHKIRAFFIRDIIDILKVEKSLEKTIDNYLYAFPVDIWVESISNKISSEIPNTNLKASTYEIWEKSKFNCALKIIDLSLKCGVSPLHVNQGAWYFASNVVADEGRLEVLISRKSISDLDEELSLIEEVLR